MPDPRFLFEPRERFPRLGWCACVVRDVAVVRVAHGAWVEASPSAFVEGAWDGDFPNFDFDRSSAFQGSGGRIRDGRLIFVSPTHPLDRLYLVRLDEKLLVSNSLSCLLAEVADGPDFTYPNYFFRLLEHFREGVSPGTVSLPTAQGRQVRLFAVCDLTVDSNLNVTTSSKSAGPEPSDYADLETYLRSAIERTTANAADPNRKHTYKPIAAVSKGYDSVASAALAAGAGCKRAFTFATSGRLGKMVDDHGGQVAAALGLECKTFHRSDVHTLPVEEQSEYFLSPRSAGDRGLGVVAGELAGALLFTGRHGERVWAKSSEVALTNLAEPSAAILSGVNPAEQRIRIGWIAFHIPYLNALQSAACLRITHSDEMRPWSVAGAYDRPIARRLAEQAGVPRELFGTCNSGGVVPALRKFSPTAQQAFEEFLAEHVPLEAHASLRREDGRRHRLLYSYSRRMLLRFSHVPAYRRLFRLFQINRLHILWRSRDLYHFHWGLHLAIRRIVG